jgi:hypothetical protein
MTTAFNGRTRGGPSAAYPRFSGKLSKVTGEGEQVELAFTAATPDELAANLAAAGAAASARLATNNDAIVRAGTTFEERQRQVYDGAVAQLRQEVSHMLTAGRRPEDEPPADEPADDEEPVGPPAPGDAPAEDKEPDADAAARALHASTDP